MRCRCCPNLNVAPPSWRLFAGWKPALHPKLGQHRAATSFRFQGKTGVGGWVLAAGRIGVKLKLPSRSRGMWMRHGPTADSFPLGAPRTDWVRLCTCPICRLTVQVVSCFERYHLGWRAPAAFSAWDSYEKRKLKSKIPVYTRRWQETCCK